MQHRRKRQKEKENGKEKLKHKHGCLSESDIVVSVDELVFLPSQRLVFEQLLKN